MTNLVDTSEETITAEFDAAEKDIGVEPTEPTTGDSPETSELEEAQRQAEIAMATGMIATSLRLTISGVSGVSVEEQHYQQAAESYAVLIIKYYPGGFFAMLDRYKEEIGALTATVMLVGVVSKAKAELRKAEEEASAKAKAEANKTGGVADGNA